MTKEHIVELLSAGEFPGDTGRPELVETHISWVFLYDRFVYKIKKPIRYSFLDFSTLEKRKYYCEREIELNKRLTHDIYLDVQPVVEISGRYYIGGQRGEVVDYAVRMRKLDRSRQMDVLLRQNDVTPSDIRNLAEKIAGFHKASAVIYKKNVLQIRDEFNDLGNERAYLSAADGAIIDLAIGSSDAFVEAHTALLAERLKSGFYRDCHGDLHSRNIFLLPDPQPFDCIEFNDEYRQIDVLNEIAFLCMDLDAFGRPELADLFLRYYNHVFPAIRSEEDRRLFLYYKSYRANVRAKVNSLRARSADSASAAKIAPDDANKYLADANKYLRIMSGYLESTQENAVTNKCLLNHRPAISVTLSNVPYSSNK
jgi:aminoglycoside phosphotransferase family enzyme